MNCPFLIIHQIDKYVIFESQALQEHILHKLQEECEIDNWKLSVYPLFLSQKRLECGIDQIFFSNRLSSWKQIRQY